MTPFEIHGPSLALSVCVVGPLLAIGNLIVWRQTRDRTVLWWAAGDLATAIAAGVMLAPLPDDGIAAYALMALALCCFWAGVRCFQRKAMERMSPAFLAGIGAALAAILMAVSLPRADGALPSLMVIVGLSAVCSRELLARQPNIAKAASRFVGVLFGFNALFFLALAYPVSFVEPGVVRLAVGAEVLILLIGWNFGVVMMAMQRYLDMAIELATHDDLTGALTRRAFGEHARRQLLLAARGSPSPSMLALDLDHFKRINDTHGHAAGDAVLVEFVRIAGTCLRRSDLLGRIGGEEFAVLLPLATGAGARALAERIREEVAAAPIVYRGESLRITVSIGVAEFGRHLRDLDGLMNAADTALYRAKHRGRNCVELLPGANSAFPTIRLDWDGRYASGHPVIDAEHEYLICMINRLIAKAQTEDDVRRLHGDLKETLHWLEQHFGHEEAIISGIGWHGAENHVDQHRQLSARGNELLAGIVDGKRSFAELLDFMIRDVIGIHLAQHDAAYFPLLPAEPAQRR